MKTESFPVRIGERTFTAEVTLLQGRGGEHLYGWQVLGMRSHAEEREEPYDTISEAVRDLSLAGARAGRGHGAEFELVIAGRSNRTDIGHARPHLLIDHCTIYLMDGSIRLRRIAESYDPDELFEAAAAAGWPDEMKVRFFLPDSGGKTLDYGTLGENRRG